MKNKVIIITVIVVCVLIFIGVSLNNYKNESIDQALHIIDGVLSDYEESSSDNQVDVVGYDFDSVELIEMNLNAIYFIVEKNGEMVYVKFEGWRHMELGMHLEIRYFDSERDIDVYSLNNRILLDKA